MKCRVCECSELDACPGGCSWVEPGLCSNCQELTQNLFFDMMQVGPSIAEGPTLEQQLDRVKTEVLKFWTDSLGADQATDKSVYDKTGRLIILPGVDE